MPHTLERRHEQPTARRQSQRPCESRRRFTRFGEGVEARLNDAGFGFVDVYVDGDLTPESISEYRASGAEVGLYVVGRYIAAAPPAPVTAAIKEIDGRAVAPRGMTPGRVPITE